MDANSQVTLAQVVANVVTQSATISGIVAPVTFGVIEALKKAGVPGKFTGLLSAPIGILVVFLVQSFHFTPLGILIGALAGLGTSGVYSAVKSATSKQ